MPNNNNNLNLSYETANKIAGYIQSKVTIKPSIGIICGTGLGTLGEAVTDATIIPYEELDGFPQSTVKGHAGRLLIGHLGGKNVILMQGRFHGYEGYSPESCAFPVRVMKLLGVEILFVTNASGGLNEKYRVGDVMILRDHINLPGLAGFSPLRGQNEERFGERFIALSDAYDSGLIKLAHEVVTKLGYSDIVHEGCYAMQMGPAFETIAECRMIKSMGGDCVGMSTVNEVTLARHCGIRCFAMSLITNAAVLSYDRNDVASHEEVLETGRQRAAVVRAVVTAMVERL